MAGEVELIAEIKPKADAFEGLMAHQYLKRGTSAEKTVPVDDDLVSVFDSADGYRPKVAKKSTLGSSGVAYVGPEAPANPPEGKLWVDSDEEGVPGTGGVANLEFRVPLITTEVQF